MSDIAKGLVGFFAGQDKAIAAKFACGGTFDGTLICAKCKRDVDTILGNESDPGFDERFNGLLNGMVRCYHEHVGVKCAEAGGRCDGTLWVRAGSSKYLGGKTADQCKAAAEKRGIKVN